MFWVLAILAVCFLAAILYTVYNADGDASLMAAERFGKPISTLEGRVVWITGASCGIGEQLAYWLARVGCRLILSARSAHALQEVKDKCVKEGRGLSEEDVMVLPLDVTDTADRHRAAVEQVLKKFEKIDILVNNAGRGQRGQAKDTDLEVDLEMMKVNVMGPISLTKAVMPHMMSRKSGHIVVNSSVNGVIAAANETMYDATKYALHGFYKALRMEMYAYNVDVSLVCPGPVFSNLQRDAYTHTTQRKYGVPFGAGDKRMDTSRCAYLMAVAMANKLDEAWVSEHPILLLTYIGQYMPCTYTWLTKHCGAFLGKFLQSAGKKKTT